MINKEPTYTTVCIRDLKPGTEFWLDDSFEDVLKLRIGNDYGRSDGRIPWATERRWREDPDCISCSAHGDLKVYVKKEGNNDQQRT